MPLPDEVRRFLQFIAPTRRPSTVKGYRFVLRRFHRWLDDQGIAIANLDRSVCLTWDQKLHERGIHPTTHFCWLVSLMKLLGHRDFRMTLRYTQIVDETVGREYFEALSRIAGRYELPHGNLADIVDLDAVALVRSAIAWIRKKLCHGPLDRRARLLARRLEQARDDLKTLCSTTPTPAS